MGCFFGEMGISACYKLGPPLLCSHRMQAAPSTTFQPAAAGAILVSATALGVGAGALLGWAFGSVGIGILIGALVGVPAGIFAVYRRYRRFFA
jgi:F0F1-type ATP synthase assembly protein I